MNKDVKPTWKVERDQAIECFIMFVIYLIVFNSDWFEKDFYENMLSGFPEDSFVFNIPYLDEIVMLIVCAIVLYHTFKHTLKAYELYHEEKGTSDRKFILVKLAETEWIKSFVIGIFSSICAALIMSFFGK